MRCWQCGAQVPADEALCPECFADLEPDAAAADDEPVCCPGCGTRCDATDATCPACGCPLDDAGLPPEEDEE
ncbi:MAG TPA: zinc ribbon domain-containing protein [candidate division WOR-3 bacterium]|uniref:Zinc ribbon domain-containing protein n=1 Tax=candidate division WOR-3 bacterium TaxID=2052148 RepID=A0A7V0T6A4_UNCW3|nr:zinc ribbon domain-containing protein [candidate division WOR-3 bacterium]